MAHLAQASKRRRLNEAASTLSRPFKSPLRTPLQKRENGDEKDESLADTKTTNNQTIRSSDEVKGQTTEVQSSTKSGDSSTTKLAVDDDNNSKVQSQPHSQSPHTIANNRNRKLPIYSQQRFASYSSKSDPELSALQKQHSALQSRLFALRSELDTAQQALRIESSNKDKELEALIAKWRAVSQEAADELFASARERVLRMGGVAAWRERENRRREMERWYDADSLADVDYDEAELESRRAEMADDVDLDDSHNKENQTTEPEEEVCYAIIPGELSIKVPKKKDRSILTYCSFSPF